MENSLVFATSLRQVDDYSFEISWTDGVVGVFFLADLQKVCPCVSCLKERPNLNKEVRAFRITSVGTYALRIHFTSGCSKGIFTFSFLRKLLRGM